jgi:cytochrome P450
VIHRNKEVYGEDVEDFRPDRWLKEDTGDMRKLSFRWGCVTVLILPGRFFFTFGSGARMCLGRSKCLSCRVALFHF